MILIDTSVWIATYRDRSGAVAIALRNLVGSAPIATTGFIRMEVLQGAADDNDWKRIATEMSALVYLPLKTDIWDNAARIYFDLRHVAITISSTIDACIAQTALDHQVELLHFDRDFDHIHTVRPALKLRRFVTGGS